MSACPHDQSELRSAAFGTKAYCHCDTCEGVWLPGPFVHAEVGPVPHHAYAVKSTRERTDLQCPDDARPLLAILHCSVEIDLCPVCSGVWLDTGEMGKIHQYRRGVARGTRRTKAAVGDGISTLHTVDGIGQVVRFVLDVLIA